MNKPGERPAIATPEAQRKKELGMIHQAATALGLIKDGQDDLYREVLRNISKVESAADLDAPGRRMLIAYFRGRGWGRQDFGHRPNNFKAPDRAGMMAKIEAILADMHLPWDYAHGMAKKLAKVARLEFCQPEGLNKVLIALIYYQKRQNAGNPCTTGKAPKTR
jgi:phage gp16-like protein